MVSMQATTSMAALEAATKNNERKITAKEGSTTKKLKGSDQA